MVLFPGRFGRRGCRYFLAEWARFAVAWLTYYIVLHGIKQGYQ